MSVPVVVDDLSHHSSLQIGSQSRPLDVVRGVAKSQQVCCRTSTTLLRSGNGVERDDFVDSVAELQIL